MIEGMLLISNRSSDYAKPNLLEAEFLVNGVFGNLLLPGPPAGELTENATFQEHYARSRKPASCSFRKASLAGSSVASRRTGREGHTRRVCDDKWRLGWSPSTQ
jgi:hypothetical protein